jgi:hypothetical protein
VIPALREVCVDRHSPYLGKIKIENGPTITVFLIEESGGEGNTLCKQILQSKLNYELKIHMLYNNSTSRLDTTWG